MCSSCPRSCTGCCAPKSKIAAARVLEPVVAEDNQTKDLVGDVLPIPGLLSETFGAVDMTPYNSDWNTMYPVSAFLSPYAVTMDVADGYVSPWVTEDAPVFYARAIRDERDDVAGTRALTLEMYHPGLIWSGGCDDDFRANEC